MTAKITLSDRVLCLEAIGMFGMTAEQAKAAIVELESRLAKAEKVVEASRNTFNRQTDPHARWAMEEIESALREYDAQGGGEGDKSV